jgi:hypothetical protein
MTEKTFSIVMITLAGLCVTLSVMFMSTANQSLANQNDIAIFQAEMQIVQNKTLEGTELNSLIPLNNKVTINYSNLALIFTSIGWLFVLIALFSLRKNKEQIISSDKIEVNKIKDLFLDMFRGFPNYRYRKDLIESVIITDSDRKELISQKILLKESINDTYTYRLGPNALPIISTWKSEKVNETLVKLTWTLVGFGILTIAFMFFIK